MDFGESPEICAVREAKEETDVDIDQVEFVAITNDFFEKENKHYITIWMKGQFASGLEKINAAYEMDQVGWFSSNELPQPIFGPLKRLIEGDSYPKCRLFEAGAV